MQWALRDIFSASAWLFKPPPGKRTQEAFHEAQHNVPDTHYIPITAHTTAYLEKASRWFELHDFDDFWCQSSTSQVASSWTGPSHAISHRVTPCHKSINWLNNAAHRWASLWGKCSRIWKSPGTNSQGLPACPCIGILGHWCKHTAVTAVYGRCCYHLGLWLKSHMSHVLLFGHRDWWRVF